MIFLRRVKNRLFLFSGLSIVIIILILLYYSPMYNGYGPISKNKVDKNNNAIDNHLTSVIRLRETQNINEKLGLKAVKKTIRRMDHDPLGVILHIPGKDNELVNPISPNLHIADSKILNSKKFHRIIHLDLKGAPPKISYLKKVLPLLRSLGATGLLIEYEDMFPYWGDLEVISAHNAYQKEDIQSLLTVARELGMEIIPLIQTFGHMEFILKLKDFAYLREVPNYPQVICPTNNYSFPLIKTMIDQIMEIHPAINWLHIGSDEVYNLGECTKCQNYILKESIQKEDLFLRHVHKISKYIKESYDVQPIMWDDELRKITLASLIKSEIGKYVELMVWQYSPGILANIGNNIWEKYGVVFNGIWVASAFKGASFPDTILTDINERLNNNKEWMDVLDMYKGTIYFKGIALTGWQRFDHFAILCELFPQGIPSIAISLSYILNRKADHSALVSVGESLGCDSFINLDLKYIEFVNHCNFPGSKVYEIAQRLFMLNKDMVQMYESNYFKGWLNAYNFKNNFASPHYVEHGLQDLSMLIYEFKKIYTDAENALNEIYDQHTVQEWIVVNLDQSVLKLNELYKGREIALKQTYWPRRPLQLPKDKEL